MTCNLVRVMKACGSYLVKSILDDNTDYRFNLENQLRIELFDNSIFSLSSTEFPNFPSIDKFEILVKKLFLKTNVND